MLSGSHVLLLAVIIILLLLGPAKLPALGRSLGDAIRGFKKGMSGDDDEIDVTDSAREKLQSNMSREEIKQKKQEKEKV